MFIIGNFINALSIIIYYVLTIYMWIIIIRALLSWVNPDPYNPIVRLLHQVTDPVLYRVRRLIPLPMVGIDLSPIIVIVIIIFLNNFLVKTLREIAIRLM